MEEKKVITEKLKDGKTKETDEKGNITIKDENGKIVGFGVFVVSKGYSGNKLKEKISELQNSAKLEEVSFKETEKENPINLDSFIQELPRFDTGKKLKKHKYTPKKFYDNKNENQR